MKNAKEDISLKQEPLVGNEDNNHKWVERFKVHNFKSMIAITTQIFLQLFLALVITQVNSFMFGWYEHKTYQAVINKITTFYTTFSFVPSLVASGVLIVGNNFIGQGKNKELSSLIVSGMMVNLFFTILTVSITNLLSVQFFNFLDIKSGDLIRYEDGSTIVYPGGTEQISEMAFARKFYAIYSCQLIFLGVAQVYISALQSIKKQNQVNIGAISSNVIDVVIVAIVLFGVKADPLWSAFSIFISTFFQMIYMGIVAHHHIKYENRNVFKLIKWNYIIQITKVGIPITMEMGLWFFCNFACQAGITSGTGSSYDLKESAINIHRGVWSLSQYSGTFLSAMGTVTSMFVSKKVGEGDLEGAYKEGINCWKLSIYMQMGLSLIMFSIVYPYLLAMHINTSQIISVGFPLYAILIVKMLFDTVNLTLLRALWSVGDLWLPLMVSVFTMVIFLGVLPVLIGVYVAKMFHNGGDTSDGAHTMILIYGVICFDPIIRATVYTIVWRRKKWKKYAKKI